MEFKVVISDPKTGKSYQRDIKDENAKRFRGKKIGDEIDGSAIGLTGYKLAVTGGSDKGGFPMKKGVMGKTASRILMKGGVGYKSKKGIRKRKRIRGEIIDEDMIQINTKIIAKGKKKIEELLGFETKEEPVEEKPPETEKPAEKVKSVEEEKSKKEIGEEAKPEKPLGEGKPVEEVKEGKKSEEKVKEKAKPEKPPETEKPVEEKHVEEKKPEGKPKREDKGKK